MAKREWKNPIGYEIQLDEQQKEAKESIFNNQINVVIGRAGCLSYGTKVLMYDGSYKEVQDVIVGDQLMGPDSTPRNVLELKRGREQMYWVRQKRAQDYRVNESHILSLKKVKPAKYSRITLENGKRVDDRSRLPLSEKEASIVNISVKEYLEKYSKSKMYMGYTNNNVLLFEPKEVSIDPYYLGLHLGDGNTDRLGITTIDDEIANYVKNYHKSLGLGTKESVKKNTKVVTYYPYTNIRKNPNTIRALFDIESVNNPTKSDYINVADKYNINVVTLSREHKKFKNNIDEYNKEHVTKLINSKYNSKNILKSMFNEYSLLGNKHIPKDYILNSEDVRLRLLAGIIDSDGYYVPKGKHYDITLNKKELIDDIAFLSRSLGFKCHVRSRLSKMKRVDGTIYENTTYRLTIMGNDLIKIPCLLPRKKAEKVSKFKDRNNHGITIEKDTVDNYYGFTLDGDNLFLLEDFTVTHNSGKTSCVIQAAIDMFFKKEISKIFITRPIVEVGKSLGFLPGELADKYNPYIEPVLDSLYAAYKDKEKIKKHIDNRDIDGYPIAYVRGKNMDDFLIIDEAQNLNELEIRALCTRLTPRGRLVFVGDVDQNDTNRSYTGLHYLLDMAKAIPEIKVTKLKNNHRSNLVGKILDWEYSRKKTSE